MLHGFQKGKEIEPRNGLTGTKHTQKSQDIPQLKGSLEAGCTHRLPRHSRCHSAKFKITIKSVSTSISTPLHTQNRIIPHICKASSLQFFCTCSAMTGQICIYCGTIYFHQETKLFHSFFAVVSDQLITDSQAVSAAVAKQPILPDTSKPK